MIVNKASFLYGSLVALSFSMNHTIYSTALLITSESQFNTTVLQAPYAVVDCYTSWCPGCKTMQKPFEDISAMSKFSHVTFTKVDIETVQSVAEKYGVTQIPTFLYFANGEKVAQDVGSSAEQVKRTLETHFPKPSAPVKKVVPQKTAPAPRAAPVVAKQTPSESSVQKEERVTTQEQTPRYKEVIVHVEEKTESFFDTTKRVVNDVVSSIKECFSNAARSIKRFFQR